MNAETEDERESTREGGRRRAGTRVHRERAGGAAEDGRGKATGYSLCSNIIIPIILESISFSNLINFLEKIMASNRYIIKIYLIKNLIVHI